MEETPRAPLPSVDVPQAADLTKLMAPPLTGEACLACKSVYNYPLARWDRMPLSILGLPRTRAEALNTRDFVMDVRQCASCGHVFHTEFNREHVPYRDGSNMVYNQGLAWSAYQDALAEEWAERYDLNNSTVVEIGCGEGLFIQRLIPRGNRCIGFEPGPDAEKLEPKGIEAYREYFQGARLFEIRPKAILCRHVLEHLASPIDFLEDLAMACREANLAPVILAETPLIEKAVRRHRINDFQYEHVSYFTMNSMRTLFERAGFDVLELVPRFGDEVVTIAARPKPDPAQRSRRTSALTFHASVQSQVERVRATLTAWRDGGEAVGIWGGTGRGMALMNMFGIDADLIPFVFDSDLRKAGGFVPGTGQEIRPPGFLTSHPMDRILITSSWRARDIEHEIRIQHGSKARLYIYHEERLCELTPELEL
jgi:SAM-dependent methyltransferase